MRVVAIRRAKSRILDDDELQHLITDRIDEDPSLLTGAGKSRTVINVDVDDSHVTLTGMVKTVSDRRRADILARALGASGVDNRLRVADEPQSPA